MNRRVLCAHSISVLIAFLGSSCGGHDKSVASLVSLPPESLVAQASSCQAITQAEKHNPLTPGHQFGFYSLAEDTTRFPIAHAETVHVIGDIHGSWQMILNAVIDSNIMQFDSPLTKQITLNYKSSNIDVEIPNLKFSPSPKNKVIFLGDYIAKNGPANEQITLGLLRDILEKQKRIGIENVVAILGNHDLEAVNETKHPGYPHEKDYSTTLLQMVRDEMLVPTYYYRGIWYSHSYITQDDVSELHARGISFLALANILTLDQRLKETSTSVAAFVNQEILNGTIQHTWLNSTSMTPGPGISTNFFYTRSSLPADGNTAIGLYQNFPVIMGHLSDLNRKELRILTEGAGGLHAMKYSRRAHILCADTSIYHSYSKGTPAKFLKIEYNPSPAMKQVQLNKCSFPTR